MTTHKQDTGLTREQIESFRTIIKFYFEGMKANADKRIATEVFLEQSDTLCDLALEALAHREKPAGDVGMLVKWLKEYTVFAYEEITRKGAKDMNEDQINHMIIRFLRWKLPEDFSPDAGISFKASYNENTRYPAKHEPTGTNLFNRAQADEMVRYMIAPAGAISDPLTKDWVESWDKSNLEAMSGHDLEMFKDLALMGLDAQVEKRIEALQEPKT